MRKLFSSLSILLLVAEFAEANTGVFFGAGNQVMPIKNTAVQLVSEKVQMKLIIDKDKSDFGVPFIPEVNVTATFNLKNTTNRTENLQIGFPFLDLQGFGNEKAVIADMRFQVISDGKELKSTIKTGLIEKKLDPNGLFKKVFVWSDKFLPQQNKTIVIKYKMRMGVASISSVMRNFDATGRKYDELDQLFSAIGYNFFYITKTAYTWKGEIESAVFEVDCSDFLKELNEGYMQPFIAEINNAKKVKTIEDSYDDLYKERMERAGLLFSSIKRPLFLESHHPAGYMTTDGIYIWKFVKTVPADGISLNFIILFMPSSLAELHSFTNTALSILKDPTPEEFKSILKTYYNILLRNSEPKDNFTKGYFKEIRWLWNKPVPVFPSDKTNLHEIEDFLNR